MSCSKVNHPIIYNSILRFIFFLWIQTFAAGTMSQTALSTKILFKYYLLNKWTSVNFLFSLWQFLSSTTNQFVNRYRENGDKVSLHRGELSVSIPKKYFKYFLHCAEARVSTIWRKECLAKVNTTSRTNLNFAFGENYVYTFIWPQISNSCQQDMTNSIRFFKLNL